MQSEKTDYGNFGRQAMEQFTKACQNVKGTQEKVLLGLLGENKNTAYGKKYGFDKIGSPTEYREKVPLSDYGDYEGYIKRMLKGESGLLTEENPAYYAISSGSTGEPKYIPVSAEGLENHYYNAFGTIFGMVGEYYKDSAPDEIYGKLFQVGEFRKNHTEGGVMCGIRSSSLFQYLEARGRMDMQIYTSPECVLFPEESTDLIYVKALFALQDKSVRGIHSVFVHRVTGMLQYMEENWELLLKDIAEGTISEQIPLSVEWRDRLQPYLLPNRERAEELSLLKQEGLSEGMLEKIWPQLKYVLCIGGSSFPKYMSLLKKYAGGVPIHYYAYAASEGVMGVGYGLNREDAYILIPEAGFFEMIPHHSKEEAEECPKLLWQLEKGRRYEVIFTNLSGFYRYRMQDVVEVVDFYNEAPVIRFCYRRNQMVNIAGEKMNTEQIEQAVSMYEKKNKIAVKQYCVYADYNVSPGRYILLIERKDDVQFRTVKTMDSCLSEVNLDYLDCRAMGEIAEAQVCILQPDTFASYREHLAARGYEMGQNKPMRIIDTKEKEQFFFSRVKECLAYAEV